MLVTVPAAYVALESDTSYDMTSSLMTGDSEKGMDLIGEYADQGMIYPDYVLLEYDEPVATVEIAYDPLTSMPAGYSLSWSSEWSDGQSAALQQMIDGVTDPETGDENISSMSGPYMWSTYANEAMAAAGIINPTDPNQLITLVLMAPQIIEQIVQEASSTEKLVLEQAMPQLREQYLYYLQQGAFDKMLGGITIPPGFESNVVDAILLIGGSGTIDYIVNYNLGLIGGSFVSSADGTGDVTYIKLSASTHDAAMSSRSMDSIAFLQSAVDDFVANNSGITATWVTGTAVVMYDISEIISGEFTQIEILVVILIIILLFFVMRSYTIPLRSVATILMSICWTLAATHLIFGDEVTWLIPLILLVICLGLGMDYDILLTTRIKENVREHGMSNDEAIHHAVVHSGSVITICGLIMGGAFGTLMLSSMGMLQQFGFALCFAILCDALIVRTYIVPAVMHLLGDWNWKGPRFLMTKAEKEQLDQKKSE